MKRCGTMFAIGVLFLGSVPSVSAQVPASYTIEDLGSFGGQLLVGTAINAHGDIAGYGELPGGIYHAFRWTRTGGLEDLGANGGWFAQAFDINDNGDVVGVYLDAEFNMRGFIAPRGGVMRDLFNDERAIQSATSITNDGRLAGSIVSFPGTRAFRTLADGSLQDLGSDDRVSSAADINKAGEVTGTEWRSSSASDPITAYRYSDGTGKVDLGTLGGSASAGASINNSGVVVGWAWDANSVGHAFRARPGEQMEDLGTLGGTYPQSGAEAINDSGTIVGYTTTPSRWTAFVYTDETGMVDLNTRIPGSEGSRVLNDARAINKAGQIVVEYAVAGRIGTYVLTPVSNDSVAPTITAATATPDVLTPPNGRMVPVTLSVSAVDDVDPVPSCSVTDVADSEGPAAGTNSSVTVTGPLALELRASRLGQRDGRTYTIGVQCSDVSGNVATTTVTVVVPHDERRK